MTGSPTPRRSTLLAPVPVGILISGRGSNMEALVRAAQAPNASYKVVCVIANRADAKGLQFAAAHDIPAVVVNHKAFDSREHFEAELSQTLMAHGVRVVALAGFMRVLTAGFVRQWQGRLVNIHPSLLPKFKGLHTHERALEAGEPEHGCTVHWVSEGVDEGEIIGQARVPIKAGDTPETLAARVLAEEHTLYPACLDKICTALRSPQTQST